MDWKDEMVFNYNFGWMIMLINIIFLVLILRLSFEKRIIESVLRKDWPVLLLVQHILFWVIFSFVNVYFYVSFVGFPYNLYCVLIALVSNAFIYYISFNKLVPEFYITKNYAQYILYTMLLFVVFSLMRILIEPGLTAGPPVRIEQGLLFIFIYTSHGICILVSSLLGISKHKFMIENDLVLLERIKKEADMNLLKSKVNPHFLLNTLNNIYAIGDNINELQSQSVLNLSQLLQYTIYETDHKKISISKELQMIMALTGLYQLKHGGELDIQFDFTEEEWMDEVEIPPAVFLTLYENALKHSAIGNNPLAWIKVDLVMEGDKLHFVIRNSISDLGEINVHYEYKGIGLTLIRQLMNIEIGIDNYSLHTAAEGDIYRAELILNL
ncbi:histidine kinase [Pedobacter sp. PAMC26386]|nr:histidine kinase [Pedobacter sp. PAMC26386]